MERKRYERLDETMFHTVLPNGLPIYVDEKPEYGKQFAFFATHYGGMNMRYQVEGGPWQETPAGVAHFLEHKMFDTEDGNALQILAANGVDPNAFTSSSLTGYYFEGTDGFEENLRTLLSFVSVPYFTPESVAKEQGIIGQEIRMGEDNPDSEVFYNLLKGLYHHNPIRVHIAGTVESIAAITADTLYACHRAFYNPGNMVLCVAGNVNADRIAEIAAQVLPASPAPAVRTDFGGEEGPQVHQALVECRMAVSAPQFQIGFKGEPPAQGEDLRQRLLGSLAGDVLFGPSSPLYARLYEQGLINGTFGGGYEAEPQCAFLAVGGESKQPEQVRDAVLAEAVRLAREGIDSDLWERQRKAAYGSMVRQLNSLENICIEAAQAHFAGEDFLMFPALFQSITKADAEEFIRRWCVPERTTLSIVWPKEV